MKKIRLYLIGFFSFVIISILLSRYLQTFYQSSMVYHQSTFNELLTRGMLPLLLLAISWKVALKQKSSNQLFLPFSLMVVGVGLNIFERLKYGYVLDYLTLPFWKERGPLFNLADFYLTISCLWLIAIFLKRTSKEKSF